jgi:hypothetical protein
LNEIRRDMGLPSPAQFEITVGMENDINGKSNEIK